CVCEIPRRLQMPNYDRPYFESQRERDRGDRERESPSSRRESGRREDDDDRGPWISRDRDDFDPREERFGRDRRFEQFEEWQRPLQMREFSGHPSSGRRFAPDQSGPGRQEPQGRYAGRGPKGYHRSDERIREDVCERLTVDPEIDAGEIEISVQDAEVTLEGTGGKRQMKRAAEDCAESVSGVQQVHNRLRVDGGRDQFESRSDEGQRSGAGRKAH